MAFQFGKHYTIEEARALLPQLRQWLAELSRSRQKVTQLDQRLGQIVSVGNDAGGNIVNDWIRHLAAIKRVLDQFKSREIQIKDIDRGLVDFPAVLAGREVFLCWEKDEEDIEFWHDLDTGYAGRERLPEA
ncbi:MAG TPA: DUF2203 domain-containing protein [Verrucomicrobiae bacterium]|jgi:hypothetical protein|nr:DUF2203 domain-containing protein [Verrucomicrobiae bacterium]